MISNSNTEDSRRKPAGHKHELILNIVNSKGSRFPTISEPIIAEASFCNLDWLAYIRRSCVLIQTRLASRYTYTCIYMYVDSVSNLWSSTSGSLIQVRESPAVALAPHSAPIEANESSISSANQSLSRANAARQERTAKSRNWNRNRTRKPKTEAAQPQNIHV